MDYDASTSATPHPRQPVGPESSSSGVCDSHASPPRTAADPTANRNQNTCSRACASSAAAGAPRAPADHVAAERQEVLQELLQRQRLRRPAHQRDHVAGEAALQRGLLVQAVQHHLRACTGCSGPPARLYRLFRTTCALVQAVQDHLRARAAVPLARGSTALYIYGDNAARSDGMGGSAWRARSSRAHVTAACCQHADARPTRCKDAEQNTSVMQSERRPSGSATMAIREHASPCMLEMLPHDRV